MLGCERRLNLTCYSPKFCPAVKSTACEISSARSPAITLVHVPLVLSLVRTTCSRLSFTPKLAPGEFGAPTATHRAEAQASQTQSPRARQTVLGACSPVLVCLGAVSHRGYPGDRSSLASSQLPSVLELHFQGEKTGWQKKALERGQRLDLPHGSREPHVGRSPRSWRASDARLRCIGAKHFPLDEASAQRSRTGSAVVGFSTQSSRSHRGHGLFHRSDGHLQSSLLLLCYWP